ncbi:MAG TPA: DUF5985 family protein [Lysobacter sp.]|nr:DUF5985 family protein [Lysobacter sp.]
MILTIYALCALAAFACAVLLFQAARRSGSRMLFWSGSCFAFLTLTNVLVLVDHYGSPHRDIWGWRLGTALVGVSVLLYGLIFEER